MKDVETITINLPVPMWKQVGWAMLMTGMSSRSEFVRITLKAAITKIHQEKLSQPSCTAINLDLAAYADASSPVDSIEEQARQRAVMNADRPRARSAAGPRKEPTSMRDVDVPGTSSDDTF
jgi:metal-responsive CopG/Arc/MetJ family transcriptional regulator